MTTTKAAGSVRAKLTLSDISEVPEAEIALVNVENPALLMAVDAPMLWSAESPNLYELLITLYDADGTGSVT